MGWWGAGCSGGGLGGEPAVGELEAGQALGGGEEAGDVEQHVARTAGTARPSRWLNEKTLLLRGFDIAHTLKADVAYPATRVSVLLYGGLLCYGAGSP